MSTPLYLVDRSRIVDGRGFCQRARLNGYHLGPTGYGIQKKATRLPLMTGIAGHDGLAPILEWCRQHDDLIQQGLQAGADLPVPNEVIRAAVLGAQQRYWKVVEVRGFAYLGEDELVKDVTREQNTLIEGLIWAWCLEVLPEVLRRGAVVEVEVDDTYVVGCTCGLGDGIGSKADHEGRDCQGIGLMCRPDFLLLTRLTQELEYHEFKTTSMDSITFRDKWEVLIQLFAATLDAERRWGKHVQTVYIHGLIKGKREGDYNPETGKRDGLIRQSSIFCYGYRKPAKPPMEPEEWSAQYEYQDAEGKNHKLGRNWKKAGVWELPVTPQDGMTKAEYWVKWMPPEARRKTLIVLGPYSRQTLMVDHFVEELKGEEARWQAGLWELYDLGQQMLTLRVGDRTDDLYRDWWTLVWPTPEFQAALDRIFPRSYECRRYGGRNRCQFEDLCFYREGWAQPIESGQFIERRPHHADELNQAVERGYLLPEEGLGDEQEMELP